MGTDREKVGINANVNILNLGCGFKKIINAVNVDVFDNCSPDIVWDLNKVPWPWAKDGEFDIILARHVFEHLDDWWAVFVECARVLKVGGTLEIRVPDESSSTALSYRDHKHIFTALSFHGIKDGNDYVTWRGGTNAWAVSQENTVPFKANMAGHVPFPRYEWMLKKRWYWLLLFCARHLRNFIHETVFIFEKID
jgi:SAM-dependent methyltransferase